MSRFAVLYSEGLKAYDLGHVISGARFQHFIDLYRKILGGHKDFELVSPNCAIREDLELVHTEAYIQRIERCESRDPHDTPLSPGFVQAAKLLAGAGKQAGEMIKAGDYEKAFVIGGGVQHANREREKGFGVFSDVGICAENLMQKCDVQRILIFDADAHAGDGIYEIFCQDPRVLFVSIHQDPATLYPGRGFLSEIGRGRGQGFSINVPLPPKAGDRAYEYAIKTILEPVADEFVPEIILMIDGSDPHYSDRITDMGLTLRGIKMVGEAVGCLAERLCEDKMVGFLGSGYSSTPLVVSLGWLVSMAGAAGVEIDLVQPESLSAKGDSREEMKATEHIVKAIQNQLAPYWRCFGY
jgi:acetoin utilization protein AcuC